jgi:hypothetical protein
LLLSNGGSKAQNVIMDKGTDETRSWLKWATTPPQSYGVYLVALVLVFVFSFYAGTMKPKGATGLGPPPPPAPMAPRN